MTYTSKRCGITVKILHTEKEVNLIKQAVRASGLPIFIELGTAGGGLTLLLHEAFPRLEIHSFDICNLPPENPLIGKPIEQTLTVVRGTFGELRKTHFASKVHFYGGDLLEGHPQVFDLLQMPQRKFLYCDNGNKERELALYAPKLRRGDILGVHDWGLDVHLPISQELKNVLSVFDPFPESHFQKAVSCFVGKKESPYSDNDPTMRTRIWQRR